MSDARRYTTLDGSFAMLHGVIESATIAFETWGELAPDRDNAVLLFTGLSPSAHAASSAEDPSSGWWEDMIGPDKPIDTSRYFVICVNSLGSCFGSTGPASTNPATNRIYRLDFPVVALEDVARAGHAVVEALGIDRLFAVVGASMGGMTALAYAVAHAEHTDGVLLISSAPRCLPFAIALRSLQRELIRTDTAWQDGLYPLDQPPITGMRLARKLGMITYRSAAEWAGRFGRERATDDVASTGSERSRTAVDGDGRRFAIDFEVESYLEAHANKFIGTFDANCYLYLSRAMDLFDVADHGGSVAAGLKRVRSKRALVIGVESDFLFPSQQQRELAEGLRQRVPDVEFKLLPSIQGHDSFLVDMDRFRPAVASFF